MSTLTRSVQSGSKWTSNDLRAYNIIIQNQPARDFFGQNLPAVVENVDPEFMTANIHEYNVAANPDTNYVLMYLDLALGPNAGMSLVWMFL